MATIIDVGHHVLERHPLRDELQTLASRGNSFLILYCVFGSGVGRTHGTLLLQFSPDFPDGLAPRETSWRCLSDKFRDLHSRKRAHFPFTRCTHRDRALPTGI